MVPIQQSIACNIGLTMVNYKNIGIVNYWLIMKGLEPSISGLEVQRLIH